MRSPLRSGFLALIATALAACGGFDVSIGPDDDDDGGGVKLFAVTASNRLISFNSDNPRTLLTDQAISGLQNNEAVLGIAFRPADGTLHALTRTRVYALNASTAVASSPETLSTALSGTAFGAAFDPAGDRLRVIGDSGQNLRVNVSNGAVTTDTAVTGTSILTALAHTNAFGAAGTVRSSDTTLFGIDVAADRLVKLTSPGSGAVTGIGPLGVTAVGDTALEIDAVNGAAFAAISQNGETRLFRMNLSPASGQNAAALIDTIGGGETVRSLAIKPPGRPSVFAVAGTNVLVKFDPLSPDAVTTIGTLVLQGGETSVLGMDFRASDRRLYALGNLGNVYRVDLASAAITRVSTLTAAPSGTAFGVDFDPVTDRLRVVSNTGQNLRANPDSGTVTVDPVLAPATATIVAAAHSNNFNEAGRTTLYDIDSAADQLLIQNRSTGALGSSQSLGVDTGDAAGFDIVGGHNGLVVAALNVGANSNLYRVDLDSGDATQVGSLPIGGTSPLAITAIAIRLSR